MSEYPYEDKIHSDDRVNYKTVYSADGIKMGKVEAAFSDKMKLTKNMKHHQSRKALSLS